MCGGIMKRREIPVGLQFISVRISDVSDSILASTKRSIVWQVAEIATKPIKMNLYWRNLSANIPTMKNLVLLA